jgi:hypothetical protein
LAWASSQKLGLKGVASLFHCSPAPQCSPGASLFKCSPLLVNSANMPTPKVWNSEADLVADLRHDGAVRVLEAISSEIDWQTTIRCAVAANTFRAFRNLPNRPSQVFRGWALDALVTRGYFERLKNVRTQNDYDMWLLDLVKDLRKCWKRRMKSSMPFGPSYKLPNLLMKCVCRRLSPSQRKRVAKFLHVALDSYTLVGIRNLVKLPDGRVISKTASMGSIKSEREYRVVQEGIRKLAKSAGVPPITYDYLAWNVSHQL